MRYATAISPLAINPSTAVTRPTAIRSPPPEGRVPGLGEPVREDEIVEDHPAVAAPHVPAGDQRYFPFGEPGPQVEVADVGLLEPVPDVLAVQDHAIVRELEVASGEHLVVVVHRATGRHLVFELADQIGTAGRRHPRAGPGSRH